MLRTSRYVSEPRDVRRPGGRLGRRQVKRGEGGRSDGDAREGGYGAWEPAAETRHAAPTGDSRPMMWFQ